MGTEGSVRGDRGKCERGRGDRRECERGQGEV